MSRYGVLIGKYAFRDNETQKSTLQSTTAMPSPTESGKKPLHESRTLQSTRATRHRGGCSWAPAGDERPASGRPFKVAVHVHSRWVRRRGLTDSRPTPCQRALARQRVALNRIPLSASGSKSYPASRLARTGGGRVSRIDQRDGPAVDLDRLAALAVPDLRSDSAYTEGNGSFRELTGARTK